uniref:Uncharacterized protein n=1 Tax=Anguilla anguilla TaxID=7936 RepID=A0A0E9WNG3_ANGAN
MFISFALIGCCFYFLCSHWLFEILLFFFYHNKQQCWSQFHFSSVNLGNELEFYYWKPVMSLEYFSAR